MMDRTPEQIGILKEIARLRDQADSLLAEHRALVTSLQQHQRELLELQERLGREW